MKNFFLGLLVLFSVTALGEDIPGIATEIIIDGGQLADTKMELFSETRTEVWFHGKGKRVLLPKGTKPGAGRLRNGKFTPTRPQPTLPFAFGEHSALVMLVNFADSPQEPWTPEYTRWTVFSTVSAFWMENSFGQTWLTGDVSGWYTIPVLSTDCDYWQIYDDALAAARSDGYDATYYDRHVVLFPRNSGCTWAGLATVGGSPSVAFSNGYVSLPRGPQVIAHELGHNLGLGHSGSLDCGSVVLGNNCSVSTYGNPIDTMGNANNGHYNAFQKERLGWAIPAIAKNGEYFIEPYSSIGDPSKKSLKVYKGQNQFGQNEFFYVEYRQAIGFDGFIDDANNILDETNILNGVLISTGAPDNLSSSRLLDMTPDTMGAWDMYDAALTVGQTFIDGRVSIKVLNASQTGVTILVSGSKGKGGTGSKGNNR